MFLNCLFLSGSVCGAGNVAQAMLANNTRLVGEGRVRKVYLAEYGDQTVAVKVLQHQDQLNRHRIEVATMDAASWLKEWACGSPKTKPLGSHFCRPLEGLGGLHLCMIFFFADVYLDVSCLGPRLS